MCGGTTRLRNLSYRGDRVLRPGGIIVGCGTLPKSIVFADEGPGNTGMDIGVEVPILVIPLSS